MKLSHLASSLNKISKILFSITMISLSNVQGQVDILWSKTYGGNSDDMGRSVQQTFEGGYILTGYTKSFGAGEGDIWLIKTDEIGNVIWTKTFGGSSYDDGYSVIQTADSGYILAGTTASFGNSSNNIWLIKVNSLGDTLWTKTLGGITTSPYGIEMSTTTDGGFIIIGTKDSYDIWLIKTDSLGDTLWTKTYGGTGIEIGESVQQTADEGYIVLGSQYGNNSPHVWMSKLDVNGDTSWTKIYGDNFYSYGYSVIQTIDKGYLIAAQCGKIWLIKTDSLGNILWSKTYRIGSSAWPASIEQTGDGGYMVFGTTLSFPVLGYETNIWLLRTDASGDTLWTKTFGGSLDEETVSGQTTLDGGCIILGIKDSYNTHYDFWLIKTTIDALALPSPPNLIYPVNNQHVNPDSINFKWSPTSANILEYSINISTDSTFSNSIDTLITDTSLTLTNFEINRNYYWHVRAQNSFGWGEYSNIATFNTDITDISDKQFYMRQFSLSQNYPNPFNPTTNIEYQIPNREYVTLKVYDIIGNEVATLVNEEKSAGSYIVQFSAEGGYVSGVYFYQLRAGNYTSTKKLILLK